MRQSLSSIHLASCALPPLITGKNMEQISDRGLPLKFPNAYPKVPSVGSNKTAPEGEKTCRLLFSLSWRTPILIHVTLSDMTWLHCWYINFQSPEWQEKLPPFVILPPTKRIDQTRLKGVFLSGRPKRYGNWYFLTIDEKHIGRVSAELQVKTPRCFLERTFPFPIEARWVDAFCYDKSSCEGQESGGGCLLTRGDYLKWVCSLCANLTPKHGPPGFLHYLINKDIVYCVG